MMVKKVCLCGSTRFKEQFEEATKVETRAGNIVLTVGFFGHADGIELSRKEKARLDALHMMKILESDEILVIDVDGYIGESTEREIEFALLVGRPVKYWREEKSRRDFLAG